MVEKVIATQAALDLIEHLKKKHGPVFFHQSGGCCDNSAANCFLPGELTIGAGDVLLGEIGGSIFFILTIKLLDRLFSGAFCGIADRIGAESAVVVFLSGNNGNEAFANPAPAARIV